MCFTIFLMSTLYLSLVKQKDIIHFSKIVKIESMSVKKNSCQLGMTISQTFLN